MKNSKIKNIIAALFIVILCALAYLRFNPQSTFEREVESMGYEIITEVSGITNFNAQYNIGSCVFFKDKDYVVALFDLVKLPPDGPENYMYRIENKDDSSNYRIVIEENLKACK